MEMADADKQPGAPGDDGEGEEPHPWERREPEFEWPEPPALVDADAAETLQRARSLYLWFVGVFQTAWEYAGLPLLFHWQWVDANGWMMPIERLVRRLILIEALAMRLGQTLAPAKTRPPPAAPDQAAPPIDADQPKPAAKPPAKPDPAIHASEWRGVHFRILPPKPGPRRIYKPKSLYDRWYNIHIGRMARTMHDPMPLARRVEALRRVLLDPTSYARRTALRLDRIAVERAMPLFLPRSERPPGLRVAPDADFDAKQKLIDLAATFWSSA
jgi:hypothetical protein